MIKPGLCSIGFAHVPWPEVITQANRVGLTGIEWSALHVVTGALDQAREVGRCTRDTGLSTCSYGSYYRAGMSQPDLSFDAVLDTALALGATTVRVWAGILDAEDCGDRQRELIVRDIVHIADQAARVGVTLGFEYHHGTLTSSPQSTARLMQEVQHEAVRFYWQAPFGRSPKYCLDSLRCLLPRLGNVHVFNWTVGSGLISDQRSPELKSLVWPRDYHRHPLYDGAACWRAYLECASSAPSDHWALLEFTKNDDWQQLAEDARVLVSLLPTEIA